MVDIRDLPILPLLEKDSLLQPKEESVISSAMELPVAHHDMELMFEDEYYGELEDF